MNSDDELRNLFEDAVSDVVPSDRLGEIRRATAKKAVRSPRRWGVVVLGAGTATAAVVGAAAVIGQLGLPGDDNDAAGPGDRRTAVATYFIGDTPVGGRLFREFQSVPASTDAAAIVLSALQRLETDAGADDPDYRTAWPAGSFNDVTVGDDWIRVDLTETAVIGAAGSSASERELGIQQAVHTAEAAVGSNLPVAFERAGAPATQVLGMPVEEQVARSTDVAAPVNITDPVEGRLVEGRFTARGTVAPFPEAMPESVAWRLLDDGGDPVTGGNIPLTDRTWSTVLNTDDLAPGTYVLSVTVPLDGDRTAVDTRTVTVR
ncbi:MAG: GerMN domain-containing protein [Propionibacteriales bacterium]|nr:GerMN domain-containing protein [Propionibacteriales bacterium]